MQRLWHFCGSSVLHDFGDNGGAGGAVHTFSDPLTDDPIELCQRCRLPLAEAYQAGALHVERDAVAARPQPASTSPHMRQARAWLKQQRKNRAKAAA